MSATPWPTFTIPQITANTLGLIPVNWFDPTELVPGGNLYSLMYSFASNDFILWQNLTQVQNSLSLLTATGTQLDLLGQDYFGSSFPRNYGETDSSYRQRIIIRLFLPIGTRPGMMTGVQRALNETPIIIEGNEGANTGGWWAGPGTVVNGPLAWGPTADVPSGSAAGGLYGGLSVAPYTCLMTVQQPAQTSPYFMTYDNIMALINSLRPLASTVWVQVLGPNGGAPIGDTFN